MKVMTKSEFKELIDQKKGSEFIALDIETEPRMRKTGNPFMGCTKSSTVSGIIGWDYETSVNNQLEREGKDRVFEARGRSWGVRVDPHWVENRGNYYLTVQVQAATEPAFVLNGERIVSEKIEPFLYDRPEIPASQADAGVEEKAVKYMDVKLENVKAARIRGEEIRIV